MFPSRCACAAIPEKEDAELGPGDLVTKDQQMKLVQEARQKSKLQAQAKAKGRPKGKAKAQAAKSKGGPKAKAKSKGGPKAKAKSKGGPKPEAKSKGGPKAKAKSKGGPKAEAAKSTHKPDSQPEEESQPLPTPTGPQLEQDAVPKAKAKTGAARKRPAAAAFQGQEENDRTAQETAAAGMALPHTFARRAKPTSASGLEKYARIVQAFDSAIKPLLQAHGVRTVAED